MKLLVIDRDRINAQLIEQRLEAFGHQITYEPSKNEAIERLTGMLLIMLSVDMLLDNLQSILHIAP